MLLDGATEAEGIAIAHRYIERLREPVAVGGPRPRTRCKHRDCGPRRRVRHRRRARAARRCRDVCGQAKWWGHCEVFRPEMAHELGDLLGLEHNLRQGLEREEFSVHYQAEIDLVTDALVGVEALVRWYSPTRGVVMPGQFIPVAEATDLIVPLGQFVLREACTQAAKWRHNSLVAEPFVMWVNVSGKQLSKGGVSTLVRHALDATSLPASGLGLEVTETALALEGALGDRARTELEELHALGVHIAIDDFGTGFSSMEQLRRFPIDVIKVDRSFIQGVEHDAKSATITANIVSLAHDLGLIAIAEGIETAGQLASARELGCDLGQGYLFARPAPADEVTHLLATYRHLTDPAGPKARSARSDPRAGLRTREFASRAAEAVLRSECEHRDVDRLVSAPHLDSHRIAHPGGPRRPGAYNPRRARPHPVRRATAAGSRC